MLSHDHKKCINKSINLAHKIANNKAAKLTPQRLQVLRILLAGHKALGAYDILEIMREQQSEGQSRPQPPTVYRALEFLLNLNLIHKVESQNSYYACMIEKDVNEQHLAQAFICDNCGNVEEKIAETGARNLYKKADSFGFKIEHVIMECRGICASCQLV